jgi:hypothetical protein
MRRISFLLSILALVGALVPGTTQARQGLGSDAGPGQSRQGIGSDDGPGLLGVDDGQGTILVTVQRGGVVGQIDRGKLTVTLRRSGDAANVLVSGAEALTSRDDKTTVYQGKDIHFRIAGFGWRVSIAGSGIDASLSGRGVVVLRGTGTYSEDGSEPAPWPTEDEPIAVGG